MVCSNEVWVFDDESRVWAKAGTWGDAPRGRRAHTAVLVGSRIFVYGGCDKNHIFDDLHYLDTISLRWSRVQLIDTCPHPVDDASGPRCNKCLHGPGPRRGHVSFTWENRLYIHGGDDGVQCLADTYVLPLDRIHFSTSTSSLLTVTKECERCVVPAVWHRMRTVGDVPTPRAHHVASVVGGIAVFHGGTDGENVFSDFSSLDLRLTGYYGDGVSGEGECAFALSAGISRGVFSRMNVAGARVSRFGHGAASLGNFVYLFGGSDGAEYARDFIVAINLLNLVVERKDGVSFGGDVGVAPRVGHAVAFLRSRGYLLGGFDGEEVLGGEDGVWALNLGGLAFVPSIRVEFAVQAGPV
ncbi:hypothetical protein HDU67_006084 [Dinochytrium kinnereticum]|nr:hypothetical protein HDU67_006084 [Dinochytrium kinnereticum]